MELITTCEIIKNQLTIASEVTLTINGVAPYPDDDIIDFELLKSTLLMDGNYFLFTCSCGVPGCGGRTKGIKTNYSNKYIYWNDLDYDKNWVFEFDSLKFQIDEIEGKENQLAEKFGEMGITYKGINEIWN